MLFRKTRLLAPKVCLLALLSVALMLYDHHVQLTQLNAIQPRVFIAQLAAPIRLLVSYPITTIDKLVEGFKTHQSLLKENIRLREEQRILSEQAQRVLALERENLKLHSLLHVPQLSPTHRIEGARLLAVSNLPYRQQVTLNRGSSSGIYLGQPVIDEKGIMGQIISITPWTSELLLITDIQSAVPVENVRNGVRAMVVGLGVPQTLKVRYVPMTAHVHVGDVWQTSGLGERYPAGYPVGVVTSVAHQTNDIFLDVTLSPSAAVNQTRHVLLLWNNKKVDSRKQDISKRKAL